MPSRLLRFEYNPLSYAYPDDESDKEVHLRALGTLALGVLIYWVNATFSDGDQVWQVVRLDRRDDVHRYVYPDLIVVDASVRHSAVTFSLGVLSRDQREAVLECADEIEYEARAGGEGQSARWMGRLLERMADEGLVAHGVVEAIRNAVSWS